MAANDRIGGKAGDDEFYGDEGNDSPYYGVVTDFSVFDDTIRFFDQDGTGSNEQIQFAQLSSGLAMTYVDIFISSY